MSAEIERLAANARKKVPLELWGPYLSERQWGTVREDYSESGNAWDYFPFEHSHARAYRWGEDGLAGISDFYQNLCFAVSLWNGKDPILKERLFGLGNTQGNHGEDVKELYYYLDNLPTHYYMEYLYKYPHEAFPYEELKTANRQKGRLEPEFEILDTDVFHAGNYFDVNIKYAKFNSLDIGIRIEVTNRGSQAAALTLLPVLWFYNRWQMDPGMKKPGISLKKRGVLKAAHPRLGSYFFYYQNEDDLLFTENETNPGVFTGTLSPGLFTRDAFQRVLIDGEDPRPFRKKKSGTRCAPCYKMHLAPGTTRTFFFRLSSRLLDNPLPIDFDEIFTLRKKEADAYYQQILHTPPDSEDHRLQRQSLAGLMWNKQFYHYDVERWIRDGDGRTAPAAHRKIGRNHEWKHLNNQDIISMPDKWEFPWYAAWDLAFQCIPMALVDPSFAKNQLLLIMREWYMKPDGQLPAYEWNFSDVNPPVQAWAVKQVYDIEKEATGKGDIAFLKRAFQKLLINFTWWLNRKDTNGNNMFEGGFLGLDNIGVFNRSNRLSDQMQLEQADGTAWMGMYALNMLDIALEIAVRDEAFEDTATKFFEQFVFIAEAINLHGMWNEEDGFFYDMLSLDGAHPMQLKIQSLVGLTSLFAVSIIQKSVLEKLKDFRKRAAWFVNYRRQNQEFWPNEEHGEKEELLLSLVPRERLQALLSRILNESEFLSPTGIRALSKFHKENPYTVQIDGHTYTIGYDPGDSTSDLFGGNSNWRGPVWIPMNYLLIRSIMTYGSFYGQHLLVEYPTGSGKKMTLTEIAAHLSRRLVKLFERDSRGLRPVFGEYNAFYQRPENKDLLLFYEYFHGDTGKGLGASHQTGWTALIADLIQYLNKKGA